MDILAKAFLSYAHADNDRENGRVLRLAEHIRNEFELLTGSTIEIFTDKAEILWGQDFRERLDESLQETTFFIPVLTPTYFLREECRKEMSSFVASASALGLRQLLLSLRYIPVPDLRTESVDELKSVAAQMQFEPWEQLRLCDEQSPEHRVAVNRLAARLVQLTQDLEGSAGETSIKFDSSGAALVAVSAQVPDRPQVLDRRDLAEKPVAEQPARTARRDDSLSTETEEDDAESGQYDDDEPGLMDLVAEMQPAMEAWGATLAKLPVATTALNEKFSAATAKMNDANPKPNAFAQKIQVARQLAIDVEPELQEIERLSKDYMAGLLRLDPSLRALFELATYSDEAESRESVSQLFGSINQLIEKAREALVNTTRAADSARANANLSRDLRPVLRRFETAMRNIGDGFTFIEAWESLAPAAIDAR